MTREEARAELDACTLRPGDASAEARSLAAKDDDLSRWLDERSKFDQRVADVFAAPAVVPATLNAELLAAMKAATAPPAPVRWRCDGRQVWMAAAAAVVIGAGALWWNVSTPTWQDDALAAVSKIQSGEVSLDEYSTDIEALKTVLADANAPLPERLPTLVADLTSIGCRVVKVAGRPASVVCFEIGDGHEAHLVIFDNHNLKDAPPQKTPLYATSGEWHTASWSYGTRSYVLATQADESELKRLFAMVRCASKVLNLA